MKSARQDDKLVLQRLTDDCKALLGKNLKAIVLFGSRASGTAGKYSDFDVLVIAEDLPGDWRKRDALILELDKHGIFDLLLYTEVELKNAIHCVNPLIMSIFDRPHKVLYGKSFIDKISKFYSSEITGHNILRIGERTWKITGGINAGIQ